MKTTICIWLCLFGWLAAAPPNPEAALKTFARYEQGQPPAWVADARAAVLHSSNDPATRAAREKELLAFLKSDATTQAKAIALSWLGVIGGPGAIPAIEEAGQVPELKDPAVAAVLRIRGIPPANEPKATRSAELDKVAAFTAALAAASPVGADRILTEALSSNDERTKLAALQAVRRGSGSPKLTETVRADIARLAEAERARVFAALATRADAGPALRPWLLRLVREGTGVERAEAARNLAMLLQAADVGALLEIASDAAHADAAGAAREALRGSNAAGVDGALAAALASASPTRIVAIELLAARNATTALDAIWKLLGDPTSEVSAAAAKALGGLVPVQQLDPCVDRLLAAGTEAERDTLARIVWDVARRHPDREVASDVLQQAAQKVPSPLKEKLAAQSQRLQPNGAAVVPVAPVPDDRPGLLPNGSDEAIRLDSGAASVASRGGVRIRRTEGAPYQFGDVALPQATVDFGGAVSYEITGLDATGSYLLGLTAWDGDNGGRVQSLVVDGEMVLPEFRPIAWHQDKATHVRLQLPVPAKALADGKITVEVRKLAGPNAVVSEVWLAKRASGDKRKRILILTGDDFPGHHWRETGPEFAAILRADPQLEVAICESPYILAAPGLAEFDTVFLHFKNYQDRLLLGEVQWRGLETYVKNGGGLVIAHFGCGACQEWSGFVNTAGRIWDPKRRGHDPYGEFLVRIANANHPVTQGLTDFRTTDELYTCLVGDPKVEVLADATSKVDQTVHPMAFVLTPGKGRVFHCPLGHDLGALKAEGARNLYLRGTRWTAGR
jgi:type 1 glutamine amidotransferase